MRGHLGCVDLLLNAGQPGLLLVRDILGCTPVHLAALQNQVALITRLVNALLRDGEGVTPLHEVARRRCMQVWLFRFEMPAHFVRLCWLVSQLGPVTNGFHRMTQHIR